MIFIHNLPTFKKPHNTQHHVLLIFKSLGRADRLEELQEQWYFQCCCPRCSDESEFGTWTSSITCPNCITNSSEQNENIYLNPYLSKDGHETENLSENANMSSTIIKKLQFTGRCGHG